VSEKDVKLNVKNNHQTGCLTIINASERYVIKKYFLNLMALPPAPPRNGEGESFSVTPPALSGKGAGGLGQKPLPLPLP